MRRRKLLQQLGMRALCNKLQGVHSDILFRWILHARSEPLIVNQKPALVIAPHQDDETLGCGGLIALKRERGVPVKVVFITDGQASHGDHSEIKPKELIQIRKQEAVTALTILGIAPSEIHFLDQLDGTLHHLSNEQRQHVIDQLVSLLQSFRPAEIYVTHQKDRHKDHEATYEMVQAAVSQSGIQVELLQYSIWMLWRAPLFFDLKLQEIAGAYRLRIDSVCEQKARAIEVYSSQKLPRSFLRRFFLPYEIFFKTEAPSNENLAPSSFATAQRKRI